MKCTQKAVDEPVQMYYTIVKKVCIYWRAGVSEMAVQAHRVPSPSYSSLSLYISVHVYDYSEHSHATQFLPGVYVGLSWLRS